jgi:hypothetical protein
VAHPYRDRWYVEDLVHQRTIAALGPSHTPSDAASLSPIEARTIEAALNALYEENR